MSEFTSAPEETSIFEDPEVYKHFERATPWQRFFNYLIDFLLMRYTMTIYMAKAVGYSMAILAPEFTQNLIQSDTKIGLYLIGYLVVVSNFLFYYTICEKAFKGVTVGKLITGTRAVRDDGTELTFKDALLRSLSRMVPFEAFSGFGNLWHDSWTKTTVIKTR